MTDEVKKMNPPDDDGGGGKPVGDEAKQAAGYEPEASRIDPGEEPPPAILYDVWKHESTHTVWLGNMWMNPGETANGAAKAGVFTAVLERQSDVWLRAVHYPELSLAQRAQQFATEAHKPITQIHRGTLHCASR